MDWVIISYTRRHSPWTKSGQSSTPLPRRYSRNGKSPTMCLPAAWLLRFSGERLVLVQPMSLGAACMAFCVGILVYLVLHELTHGIVYHLMTGEKLRFGLSWSCAWCGVPDIYVTRRTALCALLAPFVLFSAVFIALICLCSGLAAATAILLFAVHFGGCAGDLYDTLLLLFRLRGDILMRDTGPKQTFYARDAAPHA